MEPRKDQPLMLSKAADVQIIPARSLHRKLAQVMLEAERIPKRGKAPAAMGGFGFVQVGDAADYIRKALAEQVISMTPTAIEVVGQTDRVAGKEHDKTMTTLDLRVTWTLTDGESGESTTIVSYGAGADTGDKYSGKAMTNAMKYALLAGFLLSTGDDVELTDTSDRRMQRQPTTEAGRIDAENQRALAERARNGETFPAGDWSVSGIASAGKQAPVDGELRQTPDGGIFGFTVETDEKKRFQVIAEGPMALPVSLVWDSIDGQAVHVAGEVELVPWSKKDGNGVEKRMPPYRRIHATRIESGEVIIPAPLVQERYTTDDLAVRGYGDGEGEAHADFEQEMDAAAEALVLPLPHPDSR